MAAPRTRVRLRVSPGSRTSAVGGPHGDAWRVRVTPPARDNIVELTGIGPDETERRLAAAGKDV